MDGNYSPFSNQENGIKEEPNETKPRSGIKS